MPEWATYILVVGGTAAPIMLLMWHMHRAAHDERAQQTEQIKQAHDRLVSGLEHTHECLHRIELEFSRQVARISERLASIEARGQLVRRTDYAPPKPETAQ